LLLPDRLPRKSPVILALSSKDEWILISGTAGFVLGEACADDAIAQTHKSLDIIIRTLAEADADLQRY
jgi:enamine deaminase RidA (YjgF/YER057c/UK114 family)